MKVYNSYRNNYIHMLKYNWNQYIIKSLYKFSEHAAKLEENAEN